jgi:isopenicillin-N N-acyltransferase-like protein
MSTTATRTVETPVVSVSGTPEQRGETHGEHLRGLIADGIGSWAESIVSTHGLHPNDYIAAFVAGTDYLPAISRWTPDLLEEVKGIARGSRQPWEWIYAFNLLDEEWTWAKKKRQELPPGCTAVGFATDGKTPLLAQTMDIPSLFDGAQAVIAHASEDGRTTRVFTYAGMIGLTGCNSDGVAVVVNNLDVLPTSSTGLPVAFALRGILQRRNLDDAVGFVTDVPHATGQHYGIGSPAGLASVEGWGGGVAAQEELGSRLTHTNHPLMSRDARADAEIAIQRSKSRERLSYVERESQPDRDVDSIQALLRDRTVPVSLSSERSFMTFGAVVYECDTPARMWLAPGPPHETPFFRVDS